MKAHTQRSAADLFAFIGAYTASALNAEPTASVKWSAIGANLRVTVRLQRSVKTSVFPIKGIVLAAVKHRVELDAREAAIADVDSARRRLQQEVRP